MTCLCQLSLAANWNFRPKAARHSSPNRTLRPRMCHPKQVAHSINELWNMDSTESDAWPRDLPLRLASHDLDFNTAILRTSFRLPVVSHGLSVALALGIDLC